jgi:hypothetical protein
MSMSVTLVVPWSRVDTDLVAEVLVLATQRCGADFQQVVGDVGINFQGVLQSLSRKDCCG